MAKRNRNHVDEEQFALQFEPSETVGSRRLNLDLAAPYGILFAWTRASLEMKSDSEVIRRSLLAYESGAARMSKFVQLENTFDPANTKPRRVIALVPAKTRQRMDRLTAAEHVSMPAMLQRTLWSLLPTVVLYNSDSSRSTIPPVWDVEAINEILQPTGLKLENRPDIKIEIKPGHPAFS